MADNMIHNELEKRIYKTKIAYTHYIEGQHSKTLDKKGEMWQCLVCGNTYSQDFLDVYFMFNPDHVFKMYPQNDFGA